MQNLQKWKKMAPHTCAQPCTFLCREKPEKEVHVFILEQHSNGTELDLVSSIFICYEMNEWQMALFSGIGKREFCSSSGSPNEPGTSRETIDVPAPSAAGRTILPGHLQEHVPIASWPGKLLAHQHSQQPIGLFPPCSPLRHMCISSFPTRKLLIGGDFIWLAET